MNKRQEALADLRQMAAEQFDHWDDLIRRAEATGEATGWPAYELGLMLRREHARIHEDASRGEFRNPAMLGRLLDQLADLQASTAAEDETAFYLDKQGNRLT